MVSYKSSAAAIIAAAALASAQNITIISGTNGTAVSPNNGNTGTGVNINISLDITFTQTFAQLCPTGLTDVEYVFTQHCPGGCPTATPYGVPNGWEVTTAACTVCGPKTSIVTITTCPYATATATPVGPNACPSCYTDVVQYTPVPTCNTCPSGSVTTLTNVYPPPATATGVVPLTYTVSTCTNGATTVVPQTVQTPTVYTSVCPGCPATVPVNSKPATVPVYSAPATVPITPLSVPVTVCPGCPSATPVTLASVKSNAVVPTPVPYSNTSVAVPPAYTGAAAKREVGAGLMVAGALAIAVLL